MILENHAPNGVVVDMNAGTTVEVLRNWLVGSLTKRSEFEYCVLVRHLCLKLFCMRVILRCASIERPITTYLPVFADVRRPLARPMYVRF